MSDRIVALEATEYFMFTTRDFDTGAPQTLASGNISVYEDNGTTEITGADTLTASFDSVTGLNHVAVACTAANGFEAGKRYYGVMAAGTVDTVSVVGEVVFSFRIETNVERASRELREYLYPENTIATTTSNSTTAINLTDIVDAQTDDGSLVGQLLAIRDATDGALIWAVVTGLTSLLATVELYPNGGAMPITVAAGDKVWIMGPVYNHRSGTQALAQEQTANATKVGGTTQTANDVGGDVNTILSRIVGTLGTGTHVAQTGDSYARIGATGSGLTSLAQAAKLVGTIASGTHNPQSGDAFSRIGATGSGLTSLAPASATTTLLARIVGTLATGTHQPQTGDSFSRIGATGSGLTSLAPASATTTLLGRIIGTLATGTHNPQSGDSFSRIGAAGVGLTAVALADLDEAALQQIVDDLEDGGRLDLLIDAIKAKTDQMVFTKANELDTNPQSINGAALTGDGTSGTEWGPA